MDKEMSEKVWWEITRWVNNGEYLVSNYVFAKVVERATMWSVIVDGVDLVFDEEVENISRLYLMFEPAILHHVFEKYILFEKNDLETWKRIEHYLPGIVCDRTLNTDEVIDRGCVRFHDHNWNTTFEYDPHAKDGYQFKTICGDEATIFD